MQCQDIAGGLNMKKVFKDIFDKTRQKLERVLSRGKLSDNETFLEGVKRRFKREPVLMTGGTIIAAGKLAVAAATGGALMVPAVLVGAWALVIAGGLDIAIGVNKPSTDAKAKVATTVDEPTSIIFKFRDNAPQDSVTNSLHDIIDMKTIFNVKAAPQDGTDQGKMLVYTADVVKGSEARKEAEYIASVPFVEYAKTFKRA